MNLEQSSRILLIVSSIVLLAIGFTLGGNPTIFEPEIYHTNPVTDINSIAIYRSILGLLLGTSAFYLYSALSGRFRLPALYSLMLNMAFLAFSRIVSAFIDGFPTGILMVYLVLEIATGLTALGLIRSFEKKMKAS